MTVSAADDTRYQSQFHETTLKLNRFPLVEVATALINQSVFAYPLAAVTVDNTSAGWADVKAGMLIRITDGSGNLILTSVCRKDATSNTLFISAINLGDSGFAQNIASGLANNYNVTVYSVRTAWTFLSRIYNGVFFKRFDIAYTDEGSDPPPVANIGAWRQLNYEGITLSIPMVNTSFGLGAKTIASYSWVLPTGLSFASGSAATDATPTIETDTPNSYIIACTVTDSAGKTHTAYTYLFVNDSTNPALDESAVNITSDVQTRTGRTINMTLTINNDDTDSFYPGAPILLKEYPLFNGESLEGSEFVDTFCGYVADYPQVVLNAEDYTEISVIVKSPMELAASLPMAPQRIAEAVSPSNWTEMTSTYMRVYVGIWYLLYHHAPELLQLHDYDVAFTGGRRKTYELRGESLAAQITSMADYVLGSIGCLSDGTFALRLDPTIQDNTFRNALDNVYTWTAASVETPLNYPYKFRMETGQTVGYAFAYSGAQVVPLAGIFGRAQAQATGKSRMPDFVADNQADVNEKVGHWHQKQNALIPEFTASVNRNIDILDPADMVWHTFNIAATHDPKGALTGSKRTLPVRVNRQWELSGSTLIKRIQVTTQVETFGQPAQTLPIERGGAGNYVYDGSVIGVPDLFERTEDYYEQTQFALTINDAGKFARTFNFREDNPNWEDIEVDGVACDLQWDYGSAYFATGVSGDPLGAWLVAIDGTDLNVYYIYDVRAPQVDLELSTTYTTDAATTTEARVDVSRVDPDLIGVHWRRQTGCYYGQTSDGGVSWASEQVIGSTNTDTGNDNARLGFRVYSNTRLATGWNGSDYSLYIRTASTWSEVTGTDTSDAPLPTINLETDTLGYYSTGAGSGIITETLTFDDPGGTDPSYTLGSIQAGFSQSVTATGNPGNAMQGTGSLTLTGSQPTLLNINITFPSMLVTGAGFDWRAVISSITNAGANSGFIAEVSESGNPAFSNDSDSFIGTGDTGWRSSFTASAEGSLSNVDFKIKINGLGSAGDGETRTIDVYGDNIYITGETATGTRLLYRVSAVTTSPSHTDITPTGDYVPDRGFGVTINRTFKAQLFIYGEDSTPAWKRFSSLNRGDTQVDDGTTTYYGAFRSGQLIIGFGDDALGLFDGTSYDDKRGNLADIWSAVGEIKVVKAII